VESLTVHPLSYECHRISNAVFLAETVAQCSSVLAHGCVIHDHVNGVAETLNGESFLWYWRRSDSEALYVLPPEGLVSEERTDNTRFPCLKSGGSCAASTMVHDGTDLGEKPTMRCGFDEHD
jgi:hypothetical protein